MNENICLIVKFMEKYLFKAVCVFFILESQTSAHIGYGSIRELATDLTQLSFLGGLLGLPYSAILVDLGTEVSSFEMLPL